MYYPLVEPDRVIKLAGIIVEMNKAGINKQFIVQSTDFARMDQNVFELLEKRHAAKTVEAQEAILVDVHVLIDDFEEKVARGSHDS